MSKHVSSRTLKNDPSELKEFKKEFLNSWLSGRQTSPQGEVRYDAERVKWLINQIETLENEIKNIKRGAWQ